MSDVPFSYWPCSYHMYESFLENGFGLCEVPNTQVGRGVFGDLFPETRLELQEVMVDSRSYDGEGIVEICECEEGFALDVGDCYVDWIE
jgi:hypothetical protein